MKTISLKDAVSSPELMANRSVLRLSGRLCLVEDTEFARMYSGYGDGKHLEPSILVELRDGAFFERHWGLKAPVGGNAKYAHDCVIEGEVDNRDGPPMIMPRWIEFISTLGHITVPVTQCPPTIPSQPSKYWSIMSYEKGQHFAIEAVLRVDLKSGESVLMSDFPGSCPDDEVASVRQRFRATALLSSDNASQSESGHVVLQGLCMGVVTTPFGDGISKAQVDLHSIAVPWQGAYMVFFPREN